MTRLLDKAIAEMNKLSAEKQNAIAQLVLDELSDEQLWDQSFGASQEKLAKLAGKVRSAGSVGTHVFQSPVRPVHSPPSPPTSLPFITLSTL